MSAATSASQLYAPNTTPFRNKLLSPIPRISFVRLKRRRFIAYSSSKSSSNNNNDDVLCVEPSIDEASPLPHTTVVFNEQFDFSTQRFSSACCVPGCQWSKQRGSCRDGLSKL